MLASYDRVMREYHRKVRLEASLCYRESDRRVEGEEYTWTRHREPQAWCSYCQRYVDTSVNRIHSQFRRCLSCGNIIPRPENSVSSQADEVRDDG